MGDRSNSGDETMIFGTKFEYSQFWSDDVWKSRTAGGGGNTDSSGKEILYFRALQGHSGRNLIDPTLQDNFLIPYDFFEYISHIGCAINLHSITNSVLIPRDKIPARTDRRYSFCESHD